MARKKIETRRRAIRENLCSWMMERTPVLSMNVRDFDALVEAIFYGNTLPLSKGIK